EDIPHSSPRISRMAFTLLRYHSLVYVLFINSRTRLLPLCAGKWMYLQIFSYLFIVCKTSSVMSFGWEVENRTRRSGCTCATISSKSEKLTTSLTSDFSSFALLFISGDHL